jgi:hypothetical protein
MITGKACSHTARRPGQREPPLPDHIASSSDGRWGDPRHSHLPSDRHGEKERLRPQAKHRKDPGRCTEPGRDLGSSRGPSRRIPSDDGPSPRRRTLPGGRAPLAGRRPSSGTAFTLKAVSLFPRPMGKTINRIDGQFVRGSIVNSDSTEYNYQLHIGCRVLRSKRSEPV